MTSLVSDFLINPVLRQARRFSRSSLISEADSTAQPRPQSQDDVISETEEESGLMDEAEVSLSSAASSSTPAPMSNCSESPDGPHDPDTINAAASNSRDPTSPLSPNPRVSVSQLRGSNASTSSQNASAEAELPVSTSNTARSTASDLQAPTQSPQKRAAMLPEDDGMGDLRRRILLVQGQDIHPSIKARMMHDLLMEGYAQANDATKPIRPIIPTSHSWEQPLVQGPLESLKAWQSALIGEASPEKFVLTEEDIRPTFAPNPSAQDIEENTQGGLDPDVRLLGCEHYRRNVKLQCSTCSRWHTCRFCHDKSEDHALIRKETRNMLCMICGTAQRAGEICINCNETTARYYCNVCKLWDDGAEKNIYHCSDCGICRIGRGLGKDFFHCKKCCACIAMSMKDSHKCIERVTDCDCPICGDYMFTSPRPVVFMFCGHSIHRTCLSEHMKASYKCPICNKSLLNMETQFRNVDIAIEAQPMPPEFQDTRAVVLCNDCSAKTTCKYHWLGLKCAICQSYNTVQLQITGARDGRPLPDPVSERTDSTGNVASLGSNPSFEAADVTVPREIPRRRRHSSNFLAPPANPGPSTHPPDFPSSYTVPDRMVRSVSPPALGPLAGFGNSNGDGMDTGGSEEEDDGDIIGFWSRVPRSITSDDDGNEASDSEDESDSAMDEDEEIAEDDDEEEEIALFGHR